MGRRIDPAGEAQPRDGAAGRCWKGVGGDFSRCALTRTITSHKGKMVRCVRGGGRGWGALRRLAQVVEDVGRGSLRIDSQLRAQSERPCGGFGGMITQSCGRVHGLSAGQLLYGNAGGGSD